MTTSLRGRLLWGIIGGMIILLLVFSILLYNVIHRALNNQFDASLLATARILIATIETKGDFESTGQQERIELEIDTHMIPEFSGSLAAGFYQLQRQDGQLIARSPSLQQELLRIAEISEKPRYQKILLPGNKRGRSICLWFVPGGEKNETQFESAKEKKRLLTLVVARDATELYEKFKFLRLLLIGTSAAVILLSIGIGLVVVNTAMKPLNQLSGQIAAVQVDTLGHQLAFAHLPSEMVPVVHTLNNLLDRLKRSFERERCFTSDVAHELRTPLAGLRSTLEVTLLRQRDWPACQESMTDCLDIARKMQGLVDKLLEMARLDTNQIILNWDTFSVAQLADNCWKPFAESARKRGLVFENRIPGELLCRTDRECLAMALANLFENCVEYADTGGRIWIEGLENQHHLTLTVANTGCNLSPERAGKVFDRFWRADMSRSDTGIHCGLGLALVEKIIRNLAGSIQAASQNGLFLATIVLPKLNKSSDE
jgi:signal transduction histidine kinase